MGVGALAVVAGLAQCVGSCAAPGVPNGGAGASGYDDHSVDAGISDDTSLGESANLVATGLLDAAGFADAFDPADETDAGARDLSDAISDYRIYEGGSSSAHCAPGTYVGSYTGTYQNAIPTVGPVTLTLSQPTSTTEDFVLPTSGTWNAQWGLTEDGSLPIISATAMLIGQLDCKSDKFTATAANSMYTAVGFPGGTFTLVLDGTYDAATETLGGAFTYTSNAGSGGGTWQAALSD
jgi:hypothetical protein